MELLFLFLAVLIIAYSLFSARLAQFAITMPMVFLTAGIIVGARGPELTHDIATIFHNLAEITLALLLFADATHLRRETFEGSGILSARMLGIGLPLAILLGILGNWLLLDWPFWQICLLSALMAPTDAALGESIQSNEDIPEVLRDAMNAESGLNDGLTLPFVIFFASLAASASGDSGEKVALVPLLASQIGIGALVGVGVGVAAGKLRNLAVAHRYMERGLIQVATLALVSLTFFLAEMLMGNAFVAVFLCGIAYAKASAGNVSHVRAFVESDGQFLAMLSFFFIGGLCASFAFDHLRWTYVAVIALSLFVIRPLAIWLSFLGTDLPGHVRLFFGWFGPRGLATALFAIFVVMDFESLDLAQEILVVALLAVPISAFLHGISAKWAASLFRLKDDSSVS
ncbi:cation:proton antiporter [Shimia sp. SDUM112013]|uniref:cation:proton antiporter n=1 Tax=Shimia sp. SDUM112013 TaxID=3136160 RepID=UPI0032EC44BA